MLVIGFGFRAVRSSMDRYHGTALSTSERSSTPLGTSSGRFAFNL